jgi:hypothetical protein
LRSDIPGPVGGLQGFVGVRTVKIHALSPFIEKKGAGLFNEKESDASGDGNNPWWWLRLVMVLMKNFRSFNFN